MRYRVRIPVLSEGTGGKTRRHTYSGCSPEELAEKVRGSTSLTRTEMRLSGDNKTVKEYFSIWEADTWKLYVSSTRFAHRRSFEDHICPYLGSMMMDEITEGAISLWEETLEAEMISASAIRKAYSLMRRLMKTAADQHLIPYFPRMPKRFDSIRSEKQTLSPKQEELIFQNRKKDLFCMATEISRRNGLRRGEVCGLQSTDIDYGRMLFWVRRQITSLWQDGEGRTIYKPHTKACKIRFVRMDEISADLFRNLEVIQERRRWADGRKNKERWLFADCNGAIPFPEDLSAAFAKEMQETDRKVTFHSLRMTYICKRYQEYRREGNDALNRICRDVGITKKTAMGYLRKNDEGKKVVAEILGEWAEKERTEQEEYKGND